MLRYIPRTKLCQIAFAAVGLLLVLAGGWSNNPAGRPDLKSSSLPGSSPAQAKAPAGSSVSSSSQPRYRHAQLPSKSTLITTINGEIIVRSPLKVDISPPLRDIKPLPPTKGEFEGRENRPNTLP